MYIDTVVFILVAVIFIAFILNLFSIISAKQQLDVCADQLTRQIQLAGEVNSTTDSLFILETDRISFLTVLTLRIRVDLQLVLQGFFCIVLQ